MNQGSPIDGSPSNVLLCVSARTERTECPLPRVPPLRKQKKCGLLRAPIWSLFLALAIASLVVVGAVVYVLTRLGAVSAIDGIGASYRVITCTMVENEVLNFLGAMQTSTKQMKHYLVNSTIGPGNPSTADIRGKMFTILSTGPTGATSVMYGIPDGTGFA
eukprot:RCo002222